MKTIRNLSVLIVCASLTIGGCATVREYTTPENARTAAALLCANTLRLALTPEDRVQTANYIYATAHAVRTLSGGNVPTPAEFEAAIRVFTPNASKWTELANNLAAIYGALYPRIKGNSKVALDYLEAVAAGCEDAALSFMPPKP